MKVEEHDNLQNQTKARKQFQNAPSSYELKQVIKQNRKKGRSQQNILHIHTQYWCT